ncbi:MAG: Bax inhibitor-1/YccA family protein [Anaerolineae bacterium]|nr:Bax inhibitor-1/YccA family protein [Anaerolineae bacterium]
MSYYKWQEDSLPASTVRVEAQDILRWVYLWMGFGLLVTAGVAVVTVNTPALLALLASPVLWIALISELILVFALSAALPRLSPAVASLMFFVYAALNGFTLAGIFLVYTGASISAAFVATAAMFGAMTIVGFTTQIDLTRFGSFLFMGVIGLLVAMLVNLFLASSGLNLIISIVGVLLFTGLAAYDTQRIRAMAAQPQLQEDGSLAMKLSIIGALALYLDFVNMFLFLLRLLGSRD